MKKKIVVELPEDWRKRARKISNLRIKYKDDVTLFEGSPRWKQIEVERTFAQAAAHFYYGLEWKPKFKYKADFDYNDFPFPTIIRTTPHGTGFLPVQKGEQDDLVCILVTTENFPKMTLRGHIKAEDGKKKKWFRSNIHRPCYAVPQSALESPEKLKEVM